MGDNTKISWCDATWSALRGCSRTIAKGAAQSGCGDPSGGGCYAERNGYRFAGPGLPYEGLVRMTSKGARWTGKVLLVDKHLLDPMRWTKPRRIFTTSVSDPFHERFSNETIALIFGVMAATPQHKHQLLTKRIARGREWFAWVVKRAAEANDGRGMSPSAYCFTLLQRYVHHDKRESFTDHERKMLIMAATVRAALEAPWPLPQVWIGVSVENQHAADERIPELLMTPAVVRFLSIEPMIGPVTLPIVHVFGGTPAPAKIDWIICGSESGPGWRPTAEHWVRALRDQCAEAGVAFFVKQLRETRDVACGDRSERKGGGLIELPYLDGRQHTAFPERG